MTLFCRFNLLCVNRKKLRINNAKTIKQQLAVGAINAAMISPCQRGAKWRLARHHWPHAARNPGALTRKPLPCGPKPMEIRIKGRRLCIAVAKSFDYACDAAPSEVMGREGAEFPKASSRSDARRSVASATASRAMSSKGRKRSVRAISRYS